MNRQYFEAGHNHRYNRGSQPPGPDGLFSLLPEGTDLGDVILMLILLLLYLDTRDEEFLITLLATFISSQ
ncbi:MAG: hypothetical protein IJL71_02375 [Oscillospiraceae bacterium]|nr:hypothetical protein [Oscillospiraceae bacterium]